MTTAFDIEGLMETLAIAFGGESQIPAASKVAAVRGQLNNGGAHVNGETDIAPVLRAIAAREEERWWDCGVTYAEALAALEAHV